MSVSSRHGTEENSQVRPPVSVTVAVALSLSVSESLYAGIDPSTVTATSQTAYKWSFASKKTRADDEALRNAKEQIAAATYNLESSQASRGRVLGPTLPSASDRTYAREEAAAQEQEERVYKRKRDKMEAKERVEDMVGPREVGREGMMEKKRARREADRDFREKGDEGLEADETTLLGGGDSFKVQLGPSFCSFGISS